MYCSLEPCGVPDKINECVVFGRIWRVGASKLRMKGSGEVVRSEEGTFTLTDQDQRADEKDQDPEDDDAAMLLLNVGTPDA